MEYKVTRDIKFRTWITKESGYNWILEGDKDEGYIYGLENTVDFEVVGFNTEGLIWEQFTGIKDKNRKEIYFGDRLRFADKLEWYGREYTIQVLLGEMTKQEAIEHINKKPYEERTVESIEDYDWLLSHEIQTYWEICGNVHE